MTELCFIIIRGFNESLNASFRSETLHVSLFSALKQGLLPSSVLCHSW